MKRFSIPCLRVAVEEGSRSKSLHLEIDDSVTKTLEDDVAAVIRDRRPDAGLDQLLDRLDLLGILGIEELAGRDGIGAAGLDQRLAGEVESVTTPSTAGLRCCQSPSVLVTEMKSLAKNTALTPGNA